MEILELNQQKFVEDYIKSNKCEILEILPNVKTRKSKDLFLTIERLINNKILFFEIPKIDYASLDTVFTHDIISDIYIKVK